MPTLSIVVSGKVQGVFFRQSTREQAAHLHLVGEVWNNDDGTVGIIVSGLHSALDEFVRWCHSGPTRARVQTVTWETIPDQTFSAFTIRR